MKILVAPDSFKGSLSAKEFCQVCGEVLSDKSKFELDLLPLADGGEGTLDCLMDALNGYKAYCYIQDSLYEEVKAAVGFLDNGRTAVVEAALSNGLPLIKGRENPLETSTYGVGQMIGFAVDLGAKNVVLTLGGSSTNDCGLGMLAALGACFYNKDGVSFVPTGGTLKEVVDFDFSMMYPRLVGARFEAMCDVENPLCGENGCSKIFAPQKGADEKMVQELEEGCLHIKELLKARLGTDYSEIPGAGAAGGLGFAVLAGLNGSLKSGINSVLDLCNFEKRISDCDVVITGEGSFDEQSLMGKAVGGIAKRSGNKPIKVFCGMQKGNVNIPENMEVFEISKGQDLQTAIANAKDNLKTELVKAFLS